MQTYIALLRGINLGGRKKVKMAELKTVLEGLGLANVQTYIQSGNVLFCSAEEEAPLRARLEAELPKAFGFEIPVVLRGAEELLRTAKNVPFAEEEIQAVDGVERFYICFLAEPPLPQNVEAARKYEAGERWAVSGRDIYLLFPGSVRESKLATNLFRIDPSATVRNFNTVRKLCELAENM